MALGKRYKVSFHPLQKGTDKDAHRDVGPQGRRGTVSLSSKSGGKGESALLQGCRNDFHSGGAWSLKSGYARVKVMKHAIL